MVKEKKVNKTPRKKKAKKVTKKQLKKHSHKKAVKKTAKIHNKPVANKKAIMKTNSKMKAKKSVRKHSHKKAVKKIKKKISPTKSEKLKKIIKNSFGTIFKKEKPQKISEKQEIKLYAIQKLKKLDDIRDPLKKLEETGFILRIFFEKTFKIKKNLTWEEISQKLDEKKLKNKEKENLKTLCLRITELEYNDPGLNGSEVVELRNEIVQVLTTL